MAVDSKFFNIPFGATGDRATIPEATQPSGAVSYQQGFGPDYERDPATDPLAKRVPRDETNEYIYQITNAVKYLQWFGLPQYTSIADGGPPNYPLAARVRYDAGAGMQAWVSLVATNTAVPGSDATKWALDTAFDLPTLEATLAEALAGAIGTKIITPRRMSSSVQLGAWNYAVGAGTANAITASLSPAPASLIVGMEARVKILLTNTGGATLNLNGLGVTNIVLMDGSAVKPGAMASGQIAVFIFDGTNWQLQNPNVISQQLLVSNGYARMVEGIILQWGTIIGNPNGFGTLTFPTAFPSACFNVMITDQTSGSFTTVDAWGVDQITKSSFRWYTRTINTTPTANIGGGFFLAIGY